MKTLIVITTLLVSSAWAGRYNDVVYADVIDAKPIYDFVSVPERREVCERIPVYQEQRSNSKSGSILGGIIGGAIGNRFGGGSGRDAATIAGVMIGASVGSQANNNHRNNRSYRDVETRCYIDTVYTEQEQLVGYDVSYRYNGELRYVEVAEHPGKQIRLRVNVDVIQ